ncbi:anthranilate N-methyltransferase-like [Gastrolobium bilobum]|uniref:anthranilate N-methyltransferase-like n=1 Tax=Gastrolobium bilobum TaxID=150636 RepID=UPI002AB13684|nr:anthranilate N-methyltransferase-like [Gastrolobium bilobum]
MASSLETKNDEAKNLKQEEGHTQEEDGILFAMNMMNSVVVPLAIRSAIEMGIFDILAKAGEGVKLSAEDIAVQIGAKNPEATKMLDRLLRLLASHHSILYCSLGGEAHTMLYCLSPLSKYFVTDNDGVSLGAILNLNLDKIQMESWTDLKGAIMEGGVPFNRVYGMHLFEYLSLDPRYNDVFNKAMFSVTAMVMKRILECYDGFEHVNTLVDVGGGLGINLKLITSKYPHIHGVNFDLPHVLQHAPIYAGVKHEGGDMFESVPNGDAIVMKWILHDWTDEQCLKLLKNCHKAIPNDGKVIVVDHVLPALPENTANAKLGFKFDLIMMNQTPGGRERTRQEFMELALGSGFTCIRFACFVAGFYVMEFFK